VADRLAASPGGKSYGATSVIAQLSCEVRVLRKVPRTVFHPEPNVESALLVLRRRAAAPSEELVALVHAGFAHRRKALAGSLALSPGAPEDIRNATRAALESLGLPADARAERLAPFEWAGLADELGRERLAQLRPRQH
jgi:16S rRNA (adenine1518-N6/adenine1519-N6)-dimethyltransferase